MSALMKPIVGVVLIVVVRPAPRWAWLGEPGQTFPWHAATLLSIPAHGLGGRK